MTKKQLIKELEETLEKYQYGAGLNPVITISHIRKILKKHKEE